MAIARKKTAAKRTVKYAAKTQAPRQTTAGAEWVAKSAEDWQKGAADWAKQSAKFYKLPFSQEEMGTATQNAMKMGNEMLQQFFGAAAKQSAAPSFDPAAFFQFMPQGQSFDLGAAQAKLATFARESSDQVNKATQSSNRAAAEAMELGRENIEAVTEVCNMAVAVSKELMAEMISYLNRQFAQNVELSKQTLTCRTLNDMFDLATRITKTNLDAFFSESVKVSEMLFQCATDVSEPLNERMTETTDRMTKAMAA